MSDKQQHMKVLAPKRLAELVREGKEADILRYLMGLHFAIGVELRKLSEGAVPEEAREKK